MATLKILSSLFFSFFKIGCMTFGGGLAMLPLLKRELVEIKKWVTEEEIMDYFAIGQCTPGVIAVNVATFAGYKKAGTIGALAATIGIVFPSWIIITIIAACVSNFSDIVWLQKAFKGINAAVAMLLTKALFDFGKKILTDIFVCIIAAVSFAAMLFFNLQGVWIVLLSAAAGWIIKTVMEVSKRKK